MKKTGDPDSRLLFVAYLAASVSIFQGGWISLGIQTLATLALFGYFGQSIRSYSSSLGPLLWLIGFITLSKLSGTFFEPWNITLVIIILGESALIGLRLIVSLGLVYILTKVLNLTSLRDTLAWFISPLSKDLARDFSLATLILFASLPHFIFYARQTRETLACRGIRFGSHPFLVSRIIATGLLTEAAVWIGHFADALTLRGGMHWENTRSGFWESSYPLSRKIIQSLVTFGVAVCYVGSWLVFAA